ncbi:hypothetical protein [Rhodoblastus sp.]|uniref:hypothetical protein n=1 Tax=Rhodoblastus sp. TaxID=1962975 RepID=UPI0025FC445D|nr:hypothetical protein [Rhodoblastus sp.]
MKRSIGPALVLAAVFIASSAYAKTEVKAKHHHRHHTGVRPAQAIEHHAPAAARRAPAAPYFAPPLPGGSDTGGY